MLLRIGASSVAAAPLPRRALAAEQCHYLSPLVQYIFIQAKIPIPSCLADVALRGSVQVRGVRTYFYLCCHRSDCLHSIRLQRRRLL